MKWQAMIRAALRSLSSNKMRTFFMMLGIVVSVTTIMTVVSLTQGAQSTVVQGLERVGNTQTVMVTPGSEGRRPGQRPDLNSSTLTVEDAETLGQSLPKAAAVAFAAQTDGEVKAGARVVNTSVSGVSANYFSVRGMKIGEGEFFSASDVESKARVAVIGSSAAAKLFPDSSAVGQTIRIQNAAVQVIGVTRSRGASPSGRDADDVIMVPQSTFASRLFGTTNVSQILVQARSSNDLESLSKDIRRIMLERHKIGSGTKPDFDVRIPSVSAQEMFGVSNTMKWFLLAVAAISLAVGGVMIMNSMLISVGERTREIGLRKALGAKRRDILLQFLMESATVATIGGLVGVVAGFACAWSAAFFFKWPVVIVWPAALATVIFAALVGLVFGLSPANRASRLNPVEALRSE
ncbi:MAG: ABC transporter permease [Negativicutes bacterium]